MLLPSRPSNAANQPSRLQPILSLKKLLAYLLLGLALLFASSYSNDANAAGCMTNVYDKHFKKYSLKYFGPIYDWRWFKAVAITESGLCRKAVSRSGARGLMQIMPATYQEIRQSLPGLNKDSFHVESNIHAGIFYLRGLHKRWSVAMPQHATAFMLASYNGGIGRVTRAQKKAGGKLYWSAIERYLPSETRKYVSLVQKQYVKRIKKDRR